MKRPLGPTADGLLGIWHYDELTGDETVQYVQDVEPILERNKDLQSLERLCGSQPREVRPVAHIPNTIIMKWKKEGFDIFEPDNWPELARRLNDPDWRYLKTTDQSV